MESFPGLALLIFLELLMGRPGRAVGLGEGGWWRGKGIVGSDAAVGMMSVLQDRVMQLWDGD